MESTYSKYLRLFGNIFFLFLGFVVAFVLIIVAFRLLFGLLSYIPWLRVIYMLFILMMPVCVFGTAFTIFFKRTATHSSKPVKVVSYILFTAILVSWLFLTGYDLMTFFKFQYNSIDKYYTYNLLFLSINIFVLFGVGVMQALSAPKEVDWMQRGQ